MVAYFGWMSTMDVSRVKLAPPILDTGYLGILYLGVEPKIGGVSLPNHPF